MYHFNSSSTMEEENIPLPASLGSRSRTRTKQLTKKPPISMQKMHAATSSSASGNRSNVSISVEPTTNSREEEDKDEDNSLDMEDDFSLSLSSEDGGSQGEDEVHNAKRGVKRAKGDVPLSPSKCKVKRVKRADCWKYFKVVEVQSKKKFGEMVTKAKCKFCYKMYVYQPGGPTSQLNRHLDKCTAYQNKLANAKSKVSQGTISFALDDGSLVVNPTEYDHDHTRNLIAKMIIVHEYSLRMVEHRWFNILMKWMNNSYESIGRKTIKNECMKVYESEKDLLKKTLRETESISLTTDLWTSNQNVQYMSLVGHYIDENWELQCRVLNFVELDPPHTGVVIAQAIFECLVEWKIEDKVITITLDNASNNDVAITNLTSKLLARRNTQFDPLYFHVRCASHIVNLTVNDGLQPIDDLISNLRETVKYFKRSPSRMYKFMDVCKEYAVKVGKRSLS
ncbi:zinc finger BED domain-containing protein RICESLEEPER 2-like [Zea mays]|uniref:zinc finger BED domain-containing protein RICESLEEPER 2-like n=1 Tax=Zea mays TaxID=4577 RepID=UPI000C6C5F19|nr:zinc finger BED domain-containing protein RICESLEEPER 2-like [Zea mays]|eukprot:XP_023157060.1 zinc finger BED domain-containing protein RICESLEEPER 2-like [Zea mays]